MPHMTVEYSDNLRGVDDTVLMQQLNAAVCSHPTIRDEADVKTRIGSLRQYQIGLHPEGRAFAHVELGLMAGRSPEVKKELSDRIAAVLARTLPPQEGLEVQLSVNIVDMDKACYFKGKL